MNYPSSVADLALAGILLGTIWLTACVPQNYLAEAETEPSGQQDSTLGATESSGAEVEPTSAAANNDDDTSENVAASGARDLERALTERLTVRTNSDGTRRFTPHCEDGDVPCTDRIHALAELIHAAAVEHGIDPFLLGAMAIKESMLNPFVLGRRREAGILQLHPRGAGHDVPFVRDPALRRRCHGQADGCQGPIVARAAETITDSLERCGGTIEGALVRYATGHCGDPGPYVERVLTERDRLRGLAGQ